MAFEEAFERGVPWKVIAASPDMMDVTAGNRLFPPVWRSSLAISVYEPRIDEEQTQELCGQRIAFVKVTCSITGYQREGSETGSVMYGDEPLETLNDLTSEYLGCYGALLNVAFFPVEGGQATDSSLLPHILDFSPKSRELIRSISDSGEILTGSSRELKFDDSRTTTSKNETSVGLEGAFAPAGNEHGEEEDEGGEDEEADESEEGHGSGTGAGKAPGSEAGAGTGAEGGAREAPAQNGESGPSVTGNAAGKISHSWGGTYEDHRTRSLATGETQQAASRFSTNMDQLYSLLTGYHSGTNRAACLLLARPGTLQPTDRRTFVHGLRMLEGIQDFIFIVSRPATVEGLCIEAGLDTGHYPEDVPIVHEAPLERSFTFTVSARASGRTGLVVRSEDNYGQPIQIPAGAEHTFDLRLLTGGTDWVLHTERPGGWFEAGADRSRIHNPAGPGGLETDGILTSHPSLREIPVTLRQNNEFSAEAYLTISPIHARGNRWGREHALDTIVDKDFTIYARPRTARTEAIADPESLLVARRTLAACYRAEESCPTVVPAPQPPRIDVPPELLERSTGLRLGPWAPVEKVYAGLRAALLPRSGKAAREPLRTLIDTDYFARRVASRLPSHLRALSVSEVLKGHPEQEQGESFTHTTLGQLLTTSASKLSKESRCSESAVRKLRGKVLLHLERILSSGS